MKSASEVKAKIEGLEEAQGIINGTIYKNLLKTRIEELKWVLEYT